MLPVHKRNRKGAEIQRPISDPAGNRTYIDKVYLCGTKDQNH